MIRFGHEGDLTGPGLNIQSVSDGGFQAILFVWRLSVYFRKRGANNPRRPRLIFDWEWGKTWKQRQAESEQFMRGA